MKRFLMLLSFTFVAAVVLSACGSNSTSCNPASYTNGIMPQSCYTNGQQNPYGTQNPYATNPYQTNPYGTQPYYQGQQPYYGGQQGYQGYWGGSYVYVYGQNPYQYYGCRNPYCYF